MRSRWSATAALLCAAAIVGAAVVQATDVAGPQAGETRDDPVAALRKEVAGRGWIAYSAKMDDGSWDIFVVRPDGTGNRNVTNTPKVTEVGPRFSPDGTKMLYRRGGTSNHNSWGRAGEAVIADADGDNPVAPGKAGEYAWASWGPDGTTLFCQAGKEVHEVEIATGKVVRTFPHKGYKQQLTAAPDGKHVVGTASLAGPWTIVRTEAGSGKVNIVSKFQCCTPDWFPDSKRVIFSHRPRNHPTQLWMAPGDGSERTFIIGEDGMHFYGGALSPDAAYVLFTKTKYDGGGDKGGSALWVMRLADAPVVLGESPKLKELYPHAKAGPVLEIAPSAWEPHWTYAEIEEKNGGTGKQQ